MTHDPQSGVDVIGDNLPYADGAEDEIAAVLADVADRSSSSDQLAARIHDWRTMYHLSRQRSNLLRPLTVRPGMRVLDVGAGTGAISRYLGEVGANVVALEGALDRARAAALRCEDLPNVRVICGSVHDFEPDEPFDLVVVVGVLEYAADRSGAGRGAAAFLAAIRRLTATHGAVALAIENQVGLKYLLGYAEDHLSEPWAGVEGYRRPENIRTYSRAGLIRLLEDADLHPRKWLYPYPDYKLPSVVLARECFAQDDAPTLVDQLVRTPVVDHAHPRHRFCDDRAAAAVFLDAGLGEELANSFLVLAGAAEAVERLVPDDVLAWHFGAERLAPWLRTKRLVNDESGRWIEATPVLDVARHRSWLRQEVSPREAFVSGPTMERLALDALAQHDLEATARLLMEWRQAVTAESKQTAGSFDPTNPFLRPTTSELLPEDHLDVDLANFVRSQGGQLHHIDREWRALGGVDLDIVVTRALWYLAHRIIVSGAEVPFTMLMTVDELAITLGSLCEFDISASLLDDWRDAENQLQELVLGLDREAGHRQRIKDGSVSRATFPGVSSAPFTSLRRQVVALGGELKALRAELEAEAGRAAAADERETRTRDELADLLEELPALRAEHAYTESERQRIERDLQTANDHLAHYQARAAQFERRLVVRLYRLLLRRGAPV